MRGWILFVSARHFRTKRRERGHTASLLSVGGIAAGVMTLVTVLAVMNGFQIGTIENILEINSFHLRVHTSNASALAPAIANTKGVASAYPFVDMYALAQGFFEDPIAIAVRGIPHDVRAMDGGFAGKLQIVAGTFDIATPRSIVVGQELARQIGLRVGDSLSVVNFSATGLNLARPDSMDLLVTALFKTGFLEYDSGWAFVSLATTKELGGGEAQSIGVKLANRYSDRAAIRRIQSTTANIQTVSWRDYNRSIFGALRLEKTLMMLLIGLIFVVVGVNIYQSLRRSVVERTEEIGVLKTLGASPVSLQFVFVLEGLMIGLAGAAIGTALGVVISFNINAVFTGAEFVVNVVLNAAGWVTGLFASTPAVAVGFTIFSPAYFYLDSVPVDLVLGEIVGVALFALASAVVAAVAASRRVSGVVPAEVLRYE